MTIQIGLTRSKRDSMISIKNQKKIKNILLQWENLEDFVAHKKKYYKIFTIRSKRKLRKICSPIESLKTIQKKILRMTDEEELLPYVHGFIIGKSPKTNAMNHVGQRIVSSYDIVDFFPSTTSDMIVKSLSGYIVDHEVAKIIASIATLDGGLPQGSPLSPFLANVAFKSADLKLNKLALNNAGTYSRYADDFTISSSDRGIYDLERYIKGIVEDAGYKVKDAKTRHQSVKIAQVITGLTVNRKVQPVRKYRYNLKAELHNVAMSKKRLTSRRVLELKGKCNWVREFNENFFNRYLKPKLAIISKNYKNQKPLKNIFMPEEVNEFF